MTKRRARRGRKSHGPGASKQARKQVIGKMSLGCLALLVLAAAAIILPRVLSGG